MTVELMPGDILLFETDGSCIADLICELSEGVVSHAAMYYGDLLIVEEELSGLQTSPAPIPPNDPPERTVRVRRHVNRRLDMRKVVAAATRHLELKQPYAAANLAAVGCLLLSRRFVHNEFYLNLLENALKLICGVLEKISGALHPGQCPMTCSQFVSRCYSDAGAEYALHIGGRTTGKGNGVGENCLAALAARQLRGRPLPDLPALAAELQDELPPELRECPLDALTGNAESILEGICCALLRLLRSGEKGMEPQDALLPDSLPPLALYFAALMPADKRLPAADYGSMPYEHAAQALGDMQNAFVSPVDLMLRCPSLEDAGIIGGRG